MEFIIYFFGSFIIGFIVSVFVVQTLANCDINKNKNIFYCAGQACRDLLNPLVLKEFLYGFKGLKDSKNDSKKDIKKDIEEKIKIKK